MKMNATKISATGAQTQTIESSMPSGNTAYRLIQSAASVALIGSVFVLGTTPLGIFLVLPLIGIYTGLGVVFGRSPIAMIIDANKPIPYVVAPSAEVIPAQSMSARSVASSRAA